MDEFIANASTQHVSVVSPDATDLRNLLAGPKVSVTTTAPGRLVVEGLSAAQIGDVAARHHLTLHGLVPIEASLEEAFLKLTRESVEYRGTIEPHPSDRKAA
jgi:ABC-2 type transport system ATP-binding protein